jgi:Zn-dependent metalloprotease
MCGAAPQPKEVFVHDHHVTSLALALALALATPLAACSSIDDDDDDENKGAGGARLADPELPFATRDISARMFAEARAHEYLHANQAALLYGVSELWTRKVTFDHLDMAHTRVQQTYQGIAVIGGEAVVHLNPDGAVRSLTDNLVRNVAVDTTPVYSAWEAMDLAVGLHGGWARVTGVPDVELQILRQGSQDYLVYRVEIDQFEDDYQPARPVSFISAHTGMEIDSYDNLPSGRSRSTYDASSRKRLPGTLVRDEGSGPSGDREVDEAHDFGGDVYDYYFSVHGRDSFDDKGATMKATVHYGRNYVNAYWNGSQTVYGDGDGVYSTALTADDVVYHEWTHAVTQHSANLIYQNESGALNEATSDIMAAAIESWAGGNNPWWIGEDCWLADVALRFMDDPTRDGSSRDHYSTRYTGTSDNGGVHWNSGIANLAFYLMAQGGDHPKPEHRVSTVPAIGVDTAASIWYRALTVYMTSSTNFAAARVATEAACADLYDATTCASVTAAWLEVGVDSGGGGGGGGASCEGSCGGQSADGCWCDRHCDRYGDCCPDKAAVCGAR